MREPPFDQQFISYAPWVNNCTIGGSIFRDPELRTVKREGKGDLHFLRFFLGGWRRKIDTRRKLFIWVTLMRGAEYWFSVLRRGDPIVAMGELETQSWERDGKKVYGQALNAHTLTRLYRPPSMRAALDRGDAHVGSNWSDGSNVEQVDEGGGEV